MSRLVPAPDALVGKRFDVAVAKMLGISRAKAAELIEGEQARVLGRDISKSSILQSGETVEFDIVEERTEPEPIAHDMAVVYEDDDVVVVDKPVEQDKKATVGGWLKSRWVWRLMLLSAGPVRRCLAVCLTGECISPLMALQGVKASYPASTWAHLA